MIYAINILYINMLCTVNMNAFAYSNYTYYIEWVQVYTHTIIKKMVR